MVEIDVVYEGDLRCSAVHVPSKSEIHTDAPVDNHGKGELFAPTDLVAAALGTCIVTVMNIMAEWCAVDLGKVTCRVEKEMSTDTPRRIARLSAVVDIPVTVPDKTRETLEDAAHNCPVTKSLSNDIAVSVRFNWGSAS